MPFEVGRYFDRIDGQIDRWTFSAAPPETQRAYPPFEIPRFHRTLSEWLNTVVEAGFTIEQIAEPHADEETARRVPRYCRHAHRRVLPPRSMPEGSFAGALAESQGTAFRMVQRQMVRCLRVAHARGA